MSHHPIGAVTGRLREALLVLVAVSAALLGSVGFAAPASALPCRTCGGDGGGDGTGDPVPPPVRDPVPAIRTTLPAFIGSNNGVPVESFRTDQTAAVRFDACGSSSGDGLPMTSFAWRIVVAGVTTTSTACAVDVPHTLSNAAAFDATVTVTAASGRTATSHRVVPVRDLLIASIGDSAASGEGNPDVPNGSNAVWANKSCHRSGRAATSLAAENLQNANRASATITFWHLACSGASITRFSSTNGVTQGAGGLLEPQVDQLTPRRVSSIQRTRRCGSPSSTRCYRWRGRRTGRSTP